MFFVIAFSKSEGHKLSDSSISATTTLAPASIIASAVATNVKLGIITSSSFCMLIAARATLSAAVHDETACA